MRLGALCKLRGWRTGATWRCESTGREVKREWPMAESRFALCPVRLKTTIFSSRRKGITLAGVASSGLHSHLGSYTLSRIWVKRTPSKRRESSKKCCREPCSESNSRTERWCLHTFQEKCGNTSFGSSRGTTWRWSCRPTICRRLGSPFEPSSPCPTFLRPFSNELRSKGQKPPPCESLLKPFKLMLHSVVIPG